MNLSDRLTRTLVVLTLGLGAAGCGGDTPATTGPSPAGAPFAGRWSGTVLHALQGEDLHVTADMRSADGATDIYVGNISTDATRCFTNAMLTAMVSNGTFTLNALGSGSATQNCGISITGDGERPKLAGLFSMVSTLADDCNVDATPFSFTQQ